MKLTRPYSVLLVLLFALHAGALEPCPAQTCDSLLASCDDPSTCASGEICIQCGCTRPICVAKSDVPVLQRPLYRCSDGGPLATQCKAEPLADCDATIGYLCDGKCISVCLPVQPPVMPPPLPPVKAPSCPDGSWAKPCEPPNSDVSARDWYNAICPADVCGKNPAAKCVPFTCSDGKCFPNCVDDSGVVVDPPVVWPPGQQLPVCNGVPVKPGCPTARAVSQCAAIDCKPDTTCVEYWCDNTCQFTCVGTTSQPTDPPEQTWPYWCVDPPNTPAGKCDLRDRKGCNVQCPPGQVLGAFNCSGTCGCACALDINSVAGTCPVSGEPARFCQLKDDDAGCKAVRCKRGFNCAVVSCDGACAPTCLADPSYVASGYKCESGADAYSCNTNTDGGDCNGQCDGDSGTYCMVTDCGDGCKAQCVSDPNYRPYICPRASLKSASQVATKCDVLSKGDKDSVTCSALEEAEGPCSATEGFFCGEMVCGGKCSAQCLAWPWYELPSDWSCPGGSTPSVCFARPAAGSRCSDQPSLCTAPGTKCVEVSCDGVCGPICVPDPNYMPSDYACPSNPGTKAYFCSPTTGTRGCDVVDWDSGEVCQMLDCLDGKGCRSVVVADPYFRPYLCPATAVPGKKCDMASERGATGSTCGELTCTAEGTFCAELRGCVPGDASSCSAVCTRDPWFTLPDFYACPDGSSPTICDTQADAANKCSARPELSNEGEGLVCTEVACNGVCGAISVTNPYMQRPSFKCPDGSKAPFCAFMTGVVMGKTECGTCGDGEFCELFLCDGVCSARCMPLPPPTDWRFYQYDGFRPSLPPSTGCNKGGKKKGAIPPACDVSACDAVDCPIGTTCVTNADDCGNCETVCLDPMNKKLTSPLVLRNKRLKEGNTKGGGSSSSDSSDGVAPANQLCAQGQPATCPAAPDPCTVAGCDPIKHECIIERCGGCKAVCVPKKQAVCKNGQLMRACLATANFCLNVKGCTSGHCVPDPCNSCLPKCVKACPAKMSLNSLTAKCEPCPEGFSCPTPGNKRKPFPKPKPCAGGRFQPKRGQSKCLSCAKGTTTPKSKQSKGFAKCNKVK